METNLNASRFSVWSCRSGDKVSSFPFIFSSSSSCSAGWKQGRTPWGYLWNGNRSCCLSHQGSGGSQLHSSRTWAPQRHRCLAHHAQRHCLLRSLEAPFSHGPDSKVGKHWPQCLAMEENTTSGKPRLERGRTFHPGQIPSLWAQTSLWLCLAGEYGCYSLVPKLPTRNIFFSTSSTLLYPTSPTWHWA